ncbi:F-box/LRR-repeat protein 6 [Paramormyrops kingsleyae]|uniref:F-box/LRR-repeat protein 6 n=1 Tax=Paramormyrops kingsleyae TaxID=1676925 RepID=UPI000CD61C7A|nr:F-box/LRR-repeat protein 6 [Paramormyrops kingsleyae]XP_023659715.1 F-box/LRR-repeat protein 6 [Paramormyrops kingsleyae]
MEDLSATGHQDTGGDASPKAGGSSSGQRAMFRMDRHMTNSGEKKTPKKETATSKDSQKKKKKTKLYRRPKVNYTVQEGEDMLFVISNINNYDSIWKPKRKARKRKNTSGGKTKLPPAKIKTQMAKPQMKKKVMPGQEAALVPVRHCAEGEDDSWSRNLPVELLVNIFQLVLNQEGAIPFLCRAARVCQLWNSAAANPILWRRVSIGYCWTEPGKTQLPKTEMKIKNTVSWLAQNRFAQLRDFALCHWKKHVDYVVQVVSQFCPHLTSLKLTYCTGMTEKAFQDLGTYCPSLETINVQYSEFQIDGLVTYLETFGSRLRKILFTYGCKIDRLLSVIAKGCCPGLTLLEINTKLDSGFCQLPICIPSLQSSCPQLQIFRMLNVTPVMKTTRKAPRISTGFPQLIELCLATSSVSFMTDQHLNSVLHGSPNLRILDLRGCTRITTDILSVLPCEGLECLYWGLYFSSNNMVSSKKGIHLLTQKWSRTLRELDLTCQPFSEEDLEIAMANLAHGTGAELLQSLNLSSTKVSKSALRAIISQCTKLKYLNLTSCRYLPRGLKRVYRCQEDIHQLLDKIV